MYANRTAFGALLVCSAFLAATSASAQAQGDFDRNGAYLGLAGSVGIFPEVEDDLDDAGGDVDTALGLNARAGYRFHPHLAAEAEFEWVHSSVELGSFDVDFDTFVGTVNGKAFLLTGRFQPFAMIGIGGLGVDGEDDTGGDSGFAARFGGGIDVYITRNFYGALDASYVLPTGDVDDFDLVSIGWGFGYRF